MTTSYIRISVKGDLPSGEAWSVNPIYSFATPVIFGAADMAALLTALNSVAIPIQLQNTMSSGTRVLGYRAEARSTTGDLESVGEVVKSSPVNGQGTSAHSFQTAIVISLRSADSGASGKGRLYWPATGIVLNTSTLRVGATDRDNTLAGAKTFFLAIQTAIQSVTGLSAATWAVRSTKLERERIVTSIRVGDILDVQRRRRDTLVENYGVVAVP